MAVIPNHPSLLVSDDNFPPPPPTSTSSSPFPSLVVSVHIPSTGLLGSSACSIEQTTFIGGPVSGHAY